MSPQRPIDRLVVVIASTEQTGQLAQELVQHHFYFTRIDSSSGLLPDASVCLLVGIDHARISTLTRLIESCCQPRIKYIPARIENQLMQIPPVMLEAQVGGATVYTFEVENFERI